MVDKQYLASNSDAASPASEKHPSLPGELGCFVERLHIVLKGRSARSFAREAGVSETVFRKYAAGESEPTRPALLAMARAAGVSVGWLAAGEGDMGKPPGEAEPDSPSQDLRLDQEMLATAISAVDAGLGVLDVEFPSDAKTRLVLVVYRRLIERELSPAEVVAAVLQSIKQAVKL